MAARGSMRKRKRDRYRSPAYDACRVWIAHALREAQTLTALDPAADTPEGRRLAMLAARIEEYERRAFPLYP